MVQRPRWEKTVLKQGRIKGEERLVGETFRRLGGRSW